MYTHRLHRACVCFLETKHNFCSIKLGGGSCLLRLNRYLVTPTELSEFSFDDTCCVTSSIHPTPDSSTHQCSLIIPLKTFYIYIYIFIYLFIYLVAWGLSCGGHVGSSSWTRDATQAPCVESVEPYPLHHQGSL